MTRLLRTLLWLAGLSAAAAAELDQNPAMNVPASTPTQRIEQATFGGGCFWCIEAVFERVPGVLAAVSGYAGGTTDNPTYKEVCSGRTGHAEVVRVDFDPDRVSYEELLEVFWAAHDPTTLNRQGADVGTQYRSVIFYHNDAQRRAAEQSRAAAQKRFTDPMVTRIEPLKKFFPAEAYHQDYFRKHPEEPYCRVVIRPKLDKLEPKLKRR